MEALTRTIVYLELASGKRPFDEWLNSLGDQSLSQAVDARLTLVRDGNFGEHKSLGDGVFELRIPKGPGLRVYYALDGERLVLLLGGGDKSTQQRDIRAAKALWKEYRNEN